MLIQVMAPGHKVNSIMKYVKMQTTAKVGMKISGVLKGEF